MRVAREYTGQTQCEHSLLLLIHDHLATLRRQEFLCPEMLNMSTPKEHYESVLRLKRLAAELRQMTDITRDWDKDNAKKTQRKGQLSTTFRPGQYVFVVLPPLATTTVDGIAADNYSKLPHRSLAPFVFVCIGRRSFA